MFHSHANGIEKHEHNDKPIKPLLFDCVSNFESVAGKGKMNKTLIIDCPPFFSQLYQPLKQRSCVCVRAPPSPGNRESINNYFALISVQWPFNRYANKQHGRNEPQPGKNKISFVIYLFISARACIIGCWLNTNKIRLQKAQRPIRCALTINYESMTLYSFNFLRQDLAKFPTKSLLLG